MYALRLMAHESAGKITATATVWDDRPSGRYYRAEVDIVEPMSPLDFPEALRQLADAIEREINNAAAPNVEVRGD